MKKMISISEHIDEEFRFKGNKNMKETLREIALSIYKGPFKYEKGFLLDAKGESILSIEEVDLMPIDETVLHEYEPCEIENEVGKIIAEILTAEWGDKYSDN